MAVDLIARAMASKSGGGGSGGAVNSVNGQTGDVVLEAVDINALPNTTVVPTKTSQLTNDNGFVIDPNYIHTDNNFTNDYIDKANTQSDWTETDSVNIAFIKGKPTRLSQFINDNNFISNTVNNLVNYYDKIQVNNLLNNISSLKLERVDSLPTTNISKTTIYLLLKTGSIYEQYINTDSTTSGYIMIGTTEIILDNYYTKTEVNDLFNQNIKVTTSTELGIGKPDGKTIVVDGNGVYTVIGEGDMPNNITNIRILSEDSLLKISWTDSSNKYWFGTKVVMKIDSYPLNENDGILVIDNKIRNQYRDSYFELKNLQNETTYYFGFFPYSSGGTINYSSENRGKGKPSVIKLYGMRINLDDSNPDTRVEYLYEAVGMKPASMNFTTGTFDYGDWGDLWFVKNNRPVMLKYNGTVDYELDHNDLTKKLDGTPSDVANLNYEGNAMSEIPLIWVKRYNQDNWDYIIFCNEQIDETYKAYAHTNENGDIIPYNYLPIYEESLNDNKLRSMSNQTVMSNKIDSEENQYAQNNGVGWDKLSYSDCNLMYEMCTMISKSTNSQAKFGNGNSDNTVSLSTGTMNQTGQFYGYSVTNKGVKLFYCENFLGNYWKRIRGFLNINGKIHLKFTPPYNSVGTNYINTGLTPSGTNGGWCNRMSMTIGGRVPVEAFGSETTFDCDGYWFNNSINAVAVFGGDRGTGSQCGLSYWSLIDAPTEHYLYVGASLSCKPNV